MFDAISQTLADPHARHALFVHLPIAFGLLGVLPALLLAAARFDSRRASVVCVAWALTTMVGLGLAAGAGEEAYELVEAASPALSEVEHDALHEHEELGEGAWLWAVPSVLLAAATFSRRPQVRQGAGVTLILANLGLTVFVAVAGHTGGQLVYTHGLGVPERAHERGR
ncbi:MAG: hypothetical protein AAFZ65_01535 [Planctomycetota bacterium]